MEEVKKMKYIYYRIDNNPYQSYYIMNIKNDEDFLNISAEKLYNLLIEEGEFEESYLSLINSIEYKFEEGDKLIPLKGKVINTQNKSKIYIEFKMNEEIPNQNNNEDENKYYQPNIEQFEEEIKKLSLDCSNKNNFINKNSKNDELSEGKNNSNKIRIYGINQNINLEQNKNLINKNILENNDYKNDNDNGNSNNKQNKEISIFYLYSYPIDKTNTDKYEDDDKNRGNQNAIDNNDENINEGNDNNKDDKENVFNDLYEENIYYVQMFLLYEKIEKSNIKANLIFEPIYKDDFDYLEKTPDILHMKVNSSIKKDIDKQIIYIDFESREKKDSHPFKKYIKDLSKIKLFILSSQNIELFEKSIKEIDYNNVIFINSSIILEEKENTFISKLYEYLLKGFTIEKAFEQSKKESNIINDDTNIKLIKKLNNEGKMNIIIDENYLKDNNNNRENKIKLNKNCLLNLDYIKYNYCEYKKYYKAMLKRDKEMKEYMSYRLMSNKVFVYGEEGVDKKKFIQKIGYYLYEREKLDKVYYLELYSFNSNSKKILKLKMEEIKSNNYKDKENENQPIILVIVYFKLIVENIKTLEQIIGELNFPFFFIFAFTINEVIKIKQSIKLERFDELEQSQQQKYIKKFIDSKENLGFIKSIEKILKNKNNKISYSDIYLRAVYINISNNYEIEDLSNEDILEKLLFLDYKDNKNRKIDIKKIFGYFSILKFGINSDTFDGFFEEQEIDFIKSKLFYLIYAEKNEKETIYCLDNSYIETIINILIEKKEKDLLSYLFHILKYYSSIFRYLIYNSNFPYDIFMQFHPGISNDFWNNQNNIKDNYFKIAHEIYFDDVLYSNNIISLFNYKDKRYEKMVAKEKERIKESKKEEICSQDTKCELDAIEEYIGQMAIYLCTILHFKNSFIYRDSILDLFLSKIYSQPKEYEIEYKIKLKIIKYWTSEESKLYFVDRDEELKKAEKKNKNIKIELNLLKIYDYIIKKKTEDISHIFDKIKNIIKENDYINSSRLYILYGSYTNDIKYFKLAENIGKDEGNSYIELYSKIKQIELLLKKNDFNIYKEKNDFKKEIDLIRQYDKNLKNTNIREKIIDILQLYNNLFDNNIKSKLFFFTSTPFYDEKNNPLKTESNNSFYLKYKLSSELPNLQFDFRKIDKNLDNLKNCLQYPIKFLYIGSDYFNENGNICYTDDELKANFVDNDNEQFKKIIEESKCKDSCDIVILGIINGDNLEDNSLFQILKLNKFRHIIYFKKIDFIVEKFKEYPYFYIYFKKNFYNFIKEFLLNLSKSKGCLTIKEAFRRANNTFNDAMKNIQLENSETLREENETESDSNILCMFSEDENDDDICDFGTFNKEDQNKSLNTNKKDIFDENDEEDMKRNNLYFRKNPFVDEEENKNIISDKKSQKFWRFPGLRYKNSNVLIEKGFFSMKDLLRDIINIVKKYNYCNVYGNEFRGKIKICLEVCKHFFMNEEMFKKGIFVFKLKYFNAIKKNIPELNNIMNSKKKNNKKNQIIQNNIKDDNKNDILLLIEGADKLKEGLFEWLKELDVHALIISEKSLDKIYSDDNESQKKISSKSNETLNLIIDESNKKQNEKEKDIIKSINKLIKEKKMFCYNIDEEAKKFREKNKNFESEYKMYKFFKYDLK